MERIEAHEEELARYAYDQLAAEPGVEIYGPEPGPERGGLVGFNLESVHAHDLASIMNDHAVAIRAGDHCTQPLHDKLGSRRPLEPRSTSTTRGTKSTSWSLQSMMRVSCSRERIPTTEGDAVTADNGIDCSIQRSSMFYRRTRNVI